MDNEGEVYMNCRDVGNRELREEDILQFNSDGSLRERVHTAAACSLTLLNLSPDGTFNRKLVLERSIYLRFRVGSYIRE